MRIGIIGCGFVGSAIAHAHQHDEVIINDPKFPNSEPLSSFNNCDAIFICVPSPSKENGTCDTSILEGTLKNLLLVNINRPIPIISKVTAPPEEYARLQKIYPCLVHSPEFLTAKNAIIEYKYAKWCIVGGNEVSLIKGNLVDMESDLRGITLPITFAPWRQYQPPQHNQNEIVRKNVKNALTINVQKEHLPSYQMMAYPAVIAPLPFVNEVCMNPEKY